MAQHWLHPRLPLCLQPSEPLGRPLLKLMTDQESSQLRAVQFLLAATGCQVVADNNKCQCQDNGLPTAIKTYCLFTPLVKITFLTTINKIPWLGGAWLEKKAEALAQFMDILQMDVRQMAWLMPELAFDKGLADDTELAREDMESLCNMFLHMSSFNLKAGATVGRVHVWHAGGPEDSQLPN